MSGAGAARPGAKRKRGTGLSGATRGTSARVAWLLLPARRTWGAPAGRGLCAGAGSRPRALPDAGAAAGAWRAGAGKRPWRAVGAPAPGSAGASAAAPQSRLPRGRPALRAHSPAHCRPKSSGRRSGKRRGSSTAETTCTRCLQGSAFRQGRPPRPRKSVTRRCARRWRCTAPALSRRAATVPCPATAGADLQA